MIFPSAHLDVLGEHSTRGKCSARTENRVLKNTIILAQLSHENEMGGPTTSSRIRRIKLACKIFLRRVSLHKTPAVGIYSNQHSNIGITVVTVHFYLFTNPCKTINICPVSIIFGN